MELSMKILDREAICTLIREKRDTLKYKEKSLPYAVIFDIDSTIMNTEPRNLRIFDELSAQYPELQSYADQLRKEGIGWNIADALKRSGLADKKLLEQVKQFWRKRFFTDAYVIFDEPYPDAVACVKELTDDGFHILLVTGRDEPGMGKGTRAHFKDHGLIEGEHLEFYLKPEFSMRDSDFKENFCRESGHRFTITATFENEPENANLFSRNFPEALHIFIETITSPNPEPLNDSIYRARWSKVLPTIR